jgi:hypothetical protein
MVKQDKIICKHLIEILQPKIANDGLNNVLEYLIKSGIIDFRKCKVVVIRTWVNERVVKNMKAGKRAEIMNIISDAAEYFMVSEAFVHNSVYKSQGINL